jgi:hypothetical protein
MIVDWMFLARDLAAHLAAVADTEAAERILLDAERDAARLVVPPDFWSRVADEYERRARERGPEVNDLVRAKLRRHQVAH